MILGVSMRMLPALFEIPEVSTRRGWWAFGLINASIFAEVALFIAYRWTHNHALAAMLMLPWLGLLAGVLLILLPWKLWRPFKVEERSGKFVRASFAWLVVSLVMLLMLPVYQWVSGLAFSHAYYGATRHAITVGFISLMIMGFAAKVVPTLNGIDTKMLSKLWVPFVLVNVGCVLRVTLQTLTDWDPVFFSFVGISGLLEVTGLAIWGLGLATVMQAGECGEVDAGAPPCEIKAEHRVAYVLAWFPQTQSVFDAHGFTLLRNPVLRRTLARDVTLRQACTLKNIALEPLLEALNRAHASESRRCDHDHRHGDGGCTHGHAA
jgi:hypothetical protein